MSDYAVAGKSYMDELYLQQDACATIHEIFVKERDCTAKYTFRVHLVFLCSLNKLSIQ